jgi:hypothetical protein
VSEPRLVVVRDANANLAKLGDDLVYRRLDLLASDLLNLEWSASVRLAVRRSFPRGVD